ncbi:MAG TPA: formyltransferase family protein [Candidatus Limnocylindrales bacterium]|nr:formyltransferase family protein [Candidatus Limnocylindrales bacterium]
MSGRIAVGVSGAGSNLRALQAAVTRGELGAEIVLVFADRACPAIDWAAEQGMATRIVEGGDDTALAGVLAEAKPAAIVLAGYMRIVGPAVLAAYPQRILNTHPSLLPAFPGAHAVRDALAHGAAVSGVTVHLVDATLDGGPIVAQEAVAIPCSAAQAIASQARSAKTRPISAPSSPRVAAAWRARRFDPAPDTPTAIRPLMRASPRRTGRRRCGGPARRRRRRRRRFRRLRAR